MTPELPELETLTFEVVDDCIGVLRVNRPERMNSQTVKMFSEFGHVGFALRDVSLRALIVTGAGERAFCAGFDLDEIDVIISMGVRQFLKFQETATGGIQSIRHLPFPVIAAVHGPATGGGLALALAADIRLVAPHGQVQRHVRPRRPLRRGARNVVQPHPPGWSGHGRGDRLHRPSESGRKRPCGSDWPTASVDGERLLDEALSWPA